MVQAGTQTDYDQDGFGAYGEEEPEERGGGAEALQAAAKAFGINVGEASRRLGAAAEAYVSESVRILDDFAARAERSAEASREAAESAGCAAQEAQQAREAVGVVVFAASDQVEADSRKVIEEAAASIEQSVAASREAAAAAEQAAQEARTAAAEASARASETIAARESSSAGPGSREILDRLEADYSLLAQLVKELNDRMSTMTAAASGGQVVGEPAAAEGEPESLWEPTPLPAVASFAPSEAPAAAPESSWGVAAESEPAVAAPAPEGAPEAPWTEAEAPVARLAVVDAESWAPAPEGVTLEDESSPEDDAEDLTREDAPVGALREPLRQAQGGAQEEPTEGLREAAPPLEGSFQLTISPVPDFDRLLSLDGALGRLARVRSVTLADYARDEVTFRVEVGQVTDGEELASELAEASRQTLEVVSTTPERLELRVTGARS